MSLLDGDNVASGAATVYTYDARNLKTSEAFPGHGPTSNIGDANYDLVGFSYDAAGRILVKTDQQGDTCTTTYDLAGRRTSKDYRTRVNSPSGIIADTDSFTYDAVSRLTSAVSGRYNNTVAFTFDNAGRLSTEALTVSGQTYTIARGYDAASRMTQDVGSAVRTVSSHCSASAISFQHGVGHGLQRRSVTPVRTADPTSLILKRRV